MISDSASLDIIGAPVRFGPERYYVVDGDTIQILSEFPGITGKRDRLNRLRFRAIAAPEISPQGRVEMEARRLGSRIQISCSGVISADQLKAFTRGRDILVFPSGEFDQYRRNLVDIAVIPGKPGLGKISSAVSLEHLMIERRQAEPIVGVRVPELYPVQGYHSSAPGL